MDSRMLRRVMERILPLERRLIWVSSDVPSAAGEGQTLFCFGRCSMRSVPATVIILLVLSSPAFAQSSLPHLGEPALLWWIERLGGWGAFILAAYLMMRHLTQQSRRAEARVDRLVGELVEAVDVLKKAVVTFQAFEHEERETHTAIMRHLEKLQEKLNGLKS